MVGARRAAQELDRERAQPLEALAPLGRVLGREQRAPAHAEALDQAGEEDVGRDGVELRRRAAVQLDEALDPFARLRRHLRRLGRGGQPEDEVELAPARDLDDAREVDLAQLDRRARERAHDSGGVLRVDEQAHPGEHVAHLGPLEEAAVLLAAPARPQRRGAAILEPDTAQGYAALRHRAGLRSGGGPDRLGHRAADRRADRRLAAARRRARRRTVEPLAHDFAARVSDYSGLARPGRAAAARGRRPPGVDRGQPAARCARCSRRSRERARRATAGCCRGRCARSRAAAGRAGRRADGHALPARARPVRPRAARRRRCNRACCCSRPTSPRRRATSASTATSWSLWVTIHEITHAVQFSGAPWLRGHLGGMLTELIDGLQVSLAGDDSGTRTAAGPAGPARRRRPARDGRARPRAASCCG